jgi:hypothetical protein
MRREVSQGTNTNTAVAGLRMNGPSLASYNCCTAGVNGEDQPAQDAGPGPTRVITLERSTVEGWPEDRRTLGDRGGMCGIEVAPGGQADPLTAANCPPV